MPRPGKRLFVLSGLVALAGVTVCGLMFALSGSDTEEEAVLEWLERLPSLWGYTKPTCQPSGRAEDFAELPKKPRFDPNEWVREGRGLPGVRRVLGEMLQHPNRFRAARAAFALGHVGGRENVPGLMAAILVGDARTRNCAATALGKIGDPRAVELLCRVALGDVNEDVRMAAADALGAFDDPRASDCLRRLLDEEETSPVGSAAYHALERIRRRKLGT